MTTDRTICPYCGHIVGPSCVHLYFDAEAVGRSMTSDGIRLLDAAKLRIAELEAELAVAERALELACEDTAGRWAILIEGEQPKLVYTPNLRARSAAEYYAAYIAQVRKELRARQEPNP